MNNIYKVIWSKAKNCYVVASEIARSHTKSATGSGKIGGTRRSLLASLMALSLLCGGLGVAEAAVVHVNEVAGGTSAVYTTDETYTQKEVDLALAAKGAAKDVAINTAAIADLKKAVGDAGSGLTKEVADQKAAIATNTENLNTNNAAIKSLDGKLANLTTAVDGKANEADVNTKLAKKADATSVFTKDEVNTKLTDYAKSDDVYTITAADGKFATSAALNTAKTDLEGEITTAKNELDGKITANTAKITANEKAIQNLNAKAGNTETTLNNLSGHMTTAESNITDLKHADVRLEGKIDQNANDITGLKDKDVELSGNIGANKTAIDQNKTDITKNKNDIATINGKLTTAEENIATNQNAIDDLKTKVGTVNNGTYLDSSKTVGENLNKLNDGLVQEVADRKAADNALSGRITANANTIAEVNQQLVNTNNHFNTELRNTNAALQAEGKARAEADAKINTKIGNIDDTRTAYVKDANSISQNLTTLDEKLQATNDRTGGIARNAEETQTTIEGSVKVDKQGNVKDVKGLSAETITTTGNATIGDALNVTGASDLKGNVTLGTPNGTNTVTVNGKSDFKAAVEMENGLTVTNGETTLQKTDVKGALSVTGESSLKNTTVDGTLSVNKETTLNDKLTAKGEATFKENVTMEKNLEVKGELKTDKIAMENKKTDADGTIHNSATTITADGITHIGEVEKSGVTTKSSFTHNEEGSETYAMKGDAIDQTETRSDVTADGVKTEVKDSKGNRTNTSQTKEGIKGYATDKDGNKTYTKVTATENSFQVQDKDGKNKNHQVNTMGSSVTEIKNDEGKTTKTEQTATDIINTAKDGTIKNNAMNIENNASGNITNNAQNGTITNNAKDIVNNATGNMTNIVGGKLTTTVTDKATENFNGGLDTTVTGAENHTVTGKQINTVGDGQINNITGGQINNILTGDQETTVSNGSIINKAENGNISNTAKNVTNEGTESVTNKAGDMTVTTDKATGTTFGNGTPKDTTVINGGTIGTNKVNANETYTKKLTAGADDGAVGGRLTVDADGVKGSYKSSDYTSRSYILANTLKSGVDNDKDPTEDGFVGSRTDHYMDGDKAKLDETVKDADGSNVTNKTSTGTVTTITDGTTTTKTEQTDSMVQSYVGKKDGSATNVTTNFANASANMVTEDGKTSTVLNNKDGLLVRNTANGKSFNTADGTNTGTALEWTNVKGNEISTGKVEANYVKMDYADVMQDLGVRGNAKVGKNLEVTGTSTLKGDVTMESNATVKKDLKVEGTTTTKTLKVTENATVGGTLDVTQKATFHDDVDIKKNLSVDGNATIKGDVTASSYKVGDKTYISATGINANDQKITNVADGSISEGSKDAVNGGQLYTVKNDLEGKVNKVGANAAAMANLHPMEFDPDSKWNIAAAIGNYGSETAAALGAFYRPNDDVMVNLSTAFGTGENMVGGGVSVRLGKGSNKLSREENNALKDQVNDLTARMDALLSVLNPNMSKDFPDVPENHWAYEAVSRLAGNDIVQGYPDGEFHGERTMTRYEMAEIIYNALSRGAEAEKELVEEFKPELQAMAASEKATAERAEG